jgi:hypothetical protein
MEKTDLDGRQGLGPEVEVDTETVADKQDVTARSSDEVEAVGFEPIRCPSNALSRTSSWLSRRRSNNGFGVDDIDADEEPGLSGQDHQGVSSSHEGDLYEVGWDGGDNDPLNPRSMSSSRKWVIIAITSFGSFAV